MQAVQSASGRDRSLWRASKRLPD